jgi:hypothetical protein
MMTYPDKKEMSSMKKNVMLAKMGTEQRCFEVISDGCITSTVDVIDNTDTTISSTHSPIEENLNQSSLCIVDKDDN